ncbi:hypothetical protein U1Q18_037108 [Sarracenia purpurea var. burkii]
MESRRCWERRGGDNAGSGRTATAATIQRDGEAQQTLVTSMRVVMWRRRFSATEMQKGRRHEKQRCDREIRDQEWRRTDEGVSIGRGGMTALVRVQIERNLSVRVEVLKKKKKA